MTVKPGWARKRDKLRRRETAAAATGAAGPPEPDTAATGAEKSPWWAFSAADRRLLFITFAGGLGSIVAGGCVLGVAIAVARSSQPPGQSRTPLTIATVVFGVCVAFGPVGILLGKRASSDENRLRRLLARGYMALFVMITVLFGFAFVVMLLVWIGLAAFRAPA